MYKVVYNAKNLNKDSKKYGYVADLSRKFESLQDAFKYVRELRNGSDKNIQVLGMPVIERVK